MWNKLVQACVALKAFLAKSRKQVFLAVSVVVTVVACIFFCCNVVTMILAGVFAVCVFFKLQSDNSYKLPSCDSKKCNFIVNIGWSLVMFSIYITICKLLQLDSEGVTQYVPGSIVACFACTIVYLFIPIMSYYLRLYTRYYWYSTSALLMAFILLGLSGINFLYEDEKIDNIRWQKADFVSVLKYDKEVWHENTIYVVTLQDGNVFAVRPDGFPDVRRIAPGSKVRVITSRSSSAGGIPLAKRFKIE